MPATQLSISCWDPVSSEEKPTTHLPAVWTFHHWLFEDRVQDKPFSGASFQTKLSGGLKLISLTFGLWRKWGNILLLEYGDTKPSRGRLEQQGGRDGKGAKRRVFQSINNYNKNNLSRWWRLHSFLFFFFLKSPFTPTSLLAPQKSLRLRRRFCKRRAGVPRTLLGPPEVTQRASRRGGLDPGSAESGALPPSGKWERRPFFH